MKTKYISNGNLSENERARERERKQLIAWKLLLIYFKIFKRLSFINKNCIRIITS
jgi:hypothetical protein